MITQPLELDKHLRPPPRSFDVFFYVNVGVLALFLTLFTSKFVLAPGPPHHRLRCARSPAPAGRGSRNG